MLYSFPKESQLELWFNYCGCPDDWQFLSSFKTSPLSAVSNVQLPTDFSWVPKAYLKLNMSSSELESCHTPSQNLGFFQHFISHDTPISPFVWARNPWCWLFSHSLYPIYHQALSIWSYWVSLKMFLFSRFPPASFLSNPLSTLVWNTTFASHINYPHLFSRMSSHSSFLKPSSSFTLFLE